MPQIRILEADQIGAALRAARRHRKLSIRDIERRAGLNQSWLSHVERGDCRISMATFLRFCQAVEMEPWRVLRFACKNAAQEGGR